MITGESLSSKRSSLDRRSELSTGTVHDGDVYIVDDDDRNSDDGIVFGNAENTVDDGMRKRNKKGGRNAFSLLSSTFARFDLYADRSTVKDKLNFL